MKSVINYLVILVILSGCGSSGSGSSDGGTPEMEIPVVNPSLIEISVTGIPAGLGNLDGRGPEHQPGHGIHARPGYRCLGAGSIAAGV